MAYDLVKQKYPGAPCGVGIRVRHKKTGRSGNIAPPVPGLETLRVKFDGDAFATSVDPRAIEYLNTPVAALGGAREGQPR